MLLAATVEHGQTVLISSHLLHDVERVVDTVTMMHEGRVFAEGNLEEFKGRMRRVRLEGSVPPDQEQTLSQLKVVRQQLNQHVTDLIIDDYHEETQQALVQSLGSNVRIEHMNLEDIFVELSLQRSEQTLGAAS